MSAVSEVAVASKMLLLLKLNKALDLLENTASESVRFGRRENDPYWLIDDAADLINEAIVKIDRGGRRK